MVVERGEEFERARRRKLSTPPQRPARNTAHAQRPSPKLLALYRGLGARPGVFARAVGAWPLERLAARHARPACFFVRAAGLERMGEDSEQCSAPWSPVISSRAAAAASERALCAVRTNTHTHPSTPKHTNTHLRGSRTCRAARCRRRRRCSGRRRGTFCPTSVARARARPPGGKTART